MFGSGKYQAEIGNLPYIYMMTCIKLEELTKDQIRKHNDLIRAPICDIIRSDEVQRLIDDRISK